MLNLRVTDLHLLLESLTTAGIHISKNPE